MFDAPNEARITAGYLLMLGIGVTFYMRFAFPRAATDMAVRSSVFRIIVCTCWGVAIATYVYWPDVVGGWNFFMFPQVRWFTAVPAAIGILLMIWALRSHLRLDEDGKIEASGPYAWCRYPFDAALAVYFVSVTLLCANWLLISITLVLAGLHRLGVPAELERVRRGRLGPAYDAYAARTGWFLPSSAPVKKARYQVPSRFSLTAIMGLLTVLAVIFGALRAVEAPAVVYLFVGSEIVAICLVQILVGSAPRGGSALTGAILLPFWVYLTLRTPAVPPLLEFVLIVILFLFGGLMGYCIGTLAAGFFLMMDLIEPWLLRNTTAYELPSHDCPAQDGPSDSDLIPPPQRKAIQSWRESRS
jgi:protein-S-isoprenylcysteine O-methyltransferase Ste14